MSFERYMMGSCHHLAAALHRTRGFDLVAIVGSYRGSQAIFHVAAMDADGFCWDADGRHSVEDLLDQQRADGFQVHPSRLADEAALWQLTRGSGALLNPISDVHVHDAAHWADEVLGAQGLPAATGYVYLSSEALQQMEVAAASGEPPCLAEWDVRNGGPKP